MARQLFDSCVYTIALQSRLVAAADGRKFLDEGKPWVGAKEMLKLARKAGRDLAVVFADAGDISDLIGWSVITQIHVGGRKTRYTIGPLWSVPTRTPQDLTLVAGGERIAEGYRWPYALCETPMFLRREAKRPRPWIYREPAPLLAREGNARLKVHLSRERRVALVKQLKSAHMIRDRGHLPCEICGFDFLRVYGDIGEGFAEAHHIVPLAKAPKRGRSVSIKDFIIVCANCHRMLHRSPEFPSIEVLRGRVCASQKARAKPSRSTG